MALAMTTADSETGLRSPAGTQRSSSEGSTANTLFEFEHKLFRLPGAVLKFDTRGNTPMFRAKLGTLDAIIELPLLCTEFGITADSPDGRLLSVAVRGLRYVDEIRHGDLIPRELLDGTASWRVEPSHLAAARERLIDAIAAGVKAEVPAESIAALSRVAKEAFLLERDTAPVFEVLAVALGRLKDDAAALCSDAESLARELAYIEALRDYSKELHALIGKVGKLRQCYERDRNISGELGRISNLLKQPFVEFNCWFDEVDDRARAIHVILRDLPSQIAFIRDSRDRINQSLRPWRELFAAWKDLAIARSRPSEACIRSLYQFLASRYAPKKEWK